MKITFIGTSHGAPSASRYCSCYMIEEGGAIYFVDAGAPVVDVMLRRNKDINALRAVFTTHAHSDHTSGIVYLADLMNWYFGSSSCDFFITTQEHIDATKQWIFTSGDGHINEARLRFKVPTAGVVYEDERIKVEYIPTKHTPDSHAILVTAGDKRVLFGGDFSQGLVGGDVPEVIKEEIDLFVCELAHFGFGELDPYLEECRAKRVYFTHVFPDGKFDDIKAAAERYPFEVYAPADGDDIEI